MPSYRVTQAKRVQISMPPPMLEYLERKSARMYKSLSGLVQAYIEVDKEYLAFLDEITADVPRKKSGKPRDEYSKAGEFYTDAVLESERVERVQIARGHDERGVAYYPDTLVPEDHVITEYPPLTGETLAQYLARYDKHQDEMFAAERDTPPPK